MKNNKKDMKRETSAYKIMRCGSLFYIIKLFPYILEYSTEKNVKKEPGKTLNR